MAPNMARALARLGLLEELLEKTNLLARNSLRRYANYEELSSAPLMPATGEKYGAPLGVIHRGDLQGVILENARRLGIEIKTDHRVVEVDEGFRPRVKVQSGEWFEGDVVIAADGIKSRVRGQMAVSHGIKDRSYPTGDAAYRILIPREKLEHDEEALHLLEENVGMRVMGPGGHCMMYPIKPVKNPETGEEKNELYNMVLLHPAKPEQLQLNDEHESWTKRGSKADMLDFYKGWAPIIQHLLSYVPEGDVMEWTLNMHQPLPAWVEGSVALMGDACHPMLPYVAQGAAQAIEVGWHPVAAKVASLALSGLA